MEIVFKSRKENSNKGLLILTIALSLICGLYFITNNKTQYYKSSIQNNRMFNSVDTFTNR